MTQATNTANFTENITRFLSAAASYGRYSMSGEPCIPADCEVEFLSRLNDGSPIMREAVLAIRERLTVTNAYTLACFAVRMATYAVRSKNVTTLRLGVIGIIVDENLVDWRDVLIYLAVIEDCALRLGLDLNTVVSPYIDLASESRRDTILNGYLARRPDMRGLSIMGVQVSEVRGQLTYKRLAWSELANGG
jgi:hypothetical protein